MAIDLTDAFPQKFLAERLRKNEVLKDRTADIDKLASLFAGIRGIRLESKSTPNAVRCSWSICKATPAGSRICQATFASALAKPE